MPDNEVRPNSKKFLIPSPGHPCAELLLPYGVLPCVKAHEGSVPGGGGQVCEGGLTHLAGKAVLRVIEGGRGATQPLLFGRPGSGAGGATAWEQYYG